MLFKKLYIKQQNLLQTPMASKDYDQHHRNYYLDHPTSLNHREPYIIPLQNQYTALNRVRNPYHVLDNLNFEVKQKQNPSLLRTPPPTNETLNRQIRQWDRKQFQKQNSYRQLKHQLKDLSKMIKVKETQYQLDKIRAQCSHPMGNQSFMPYPLLMPVPPMNGWPMQMWNNACQCHCQCKCNCKRQSNEPIRRSYPRMSKKYKPIMTQNHEISTQTPQITKQNPPNSVPSIKSVKSQPKNQPKTQPKQIVHLQKKKKSNLLRRFRICAYAVYFCIYFKWFSFQFSLNRYNRFKIKYLADSGVKITQSYKQVYQKMLEINIPELIRKAASNIPNPKPTKKNNKLDLSTLLKQQSIAKLKTIDSFTILTYEQQTLFLRCAQFLKLLFQQLEDTFRGWTWGELGESLGVGAINQTFLIDNYFLPHEIYLMLLHEGKGYAQISPEHERCEVMVKFLVKMLLFNVCLQLDNNREWLDLHEKELEARGDGNQIFVFLEISSKILFISCQYLYQQVLGSHETNYDDVHERFKIQPCNPLIYSHSIRRRRQMFKEEDVKDSNLLIYGIEKLDEVNNIVKQNFFKDSSNKINKLISTFLDNILNKLKEDNKQLYSKIWQETLNNEYIILRGLKKIMKSTRYYPFISNQNIVSKRNVNTKKDINDYNSSNSKKLVGSKLNAGTKNDLTSEYYSGQQSSPYMGSFRTKVSIKNFLPKK